MVVEGNKAFGYLRYQKMATKQKQNLGGDGDSSAKKTFMFIYRFLMESWITMFLFWTQE